MAINQLIAAGIQPPRFESPYNMMAQFAQIQQAQQANALNQMRMQQMERQMAQEEALAGALRSGRPLTLEQALMGGERGLRALELQETFGERERKRKSAGQQLAAEALMETSPNLGDFAETYRRLKEQGVDMGPRAAELMLMPQEQRAREMQREVALTPGMGPVVAAREKSAAEVAKLIAERRRQEGEFQKLQMQMQGTLPAGPGAPSELTRLIAERDKLPPNDPNRAAYDARIEALGRVGGTTVNVGAGEREEEKARGAGLAKEEETVSTLAQSARRQLTSIDSAQRVLDAGFRTGFGTDVKAKAANFLAAMGVKDAGKFATNAQTFLQAIKENVLAKQLEQKGVQTNQDAERIEQTFAQLGNTPEANQFMLDVARAQAKRSIEQDQFYRKWIAENKTMRGARDAWFETEGDKSLFERPELQRYAPQQRGSAGGEQPEVIDFRSLKR
jgi:hypothetical protein